MIIERDLSERKIAPFHLNSINLTQNRFGKNFGGQNETEPQLPNVTKWKFLLYRIVIASCSKGLYWQSFLRRYATQPEYKLKNFTKKNILRIFIVFITVMFEHQQSTINTSLLLLIY